MSEQDEWGVIRRVGIQIDFQTDPLPGWGYAIPVVGRDWQGPFLTKVDALEAALHYLVDRASQKTIPDHPLETADSVLRQIEALQQRDLLLRRELGQLGRQAIRLHGSVPEEVVSRIKDLEQEIAVICDQITELANKTDEAALRRARQSRGSSLDRPT